MAEEQEEENPFKKGAEVEVSFEEEGFRGSWYSATVVRTFSNKNNNNNKKKQKILLEFHNLTSDDHGTKPLREFVDVILVRPVPPREPHRTFKLSEEVDAFHNDGWWEGVVLQLQLQPQPSPNPAYSVFFRSSREQLVFHESDLRLHREWDHGTWVPPLEPPPPPPLLNSSGCDG